MKGAGRIAACWLLAALCCASGCVNQNPSYFPYSFLPFGDITQTHAKPPGAGYYANFDPHAVRLEVRPYKDGGQDVTNQVRTQHVLIATIYDEKGQPRRNRRVEWMVEGVGHIIEVDESGYFSGRGYKTSNKHAVSYTNSGENRVTRGTTGREDDFMIRPGQTWCVLNSPVEGDTHVTVYAPGIADWQKNKIDVTVRWVDSIWEFPPPAQKPAGTEHTFVTRVFRSSTKQPLANYRVRYRIKDGPAAYFLPDKSQEFIAVSDINGNAEARIAQVRLGDQLPPPGVNNVDIEIIRPPDPTTPSGSGIVISRGMSSVEWLAPNVTLNYTGPSIALVNDEVTYTATLQNMGKVPSDVIELTSAVPRGMDFVRANPPPTPDVRGDMLFILKNLPPGASNTVSLTFKARELGQTSSVMTMRTGGQTDRKEVLTNIADARLKVSIEGPQRGTLGQPVPLVVKVVNQGGAVLTNVKLVATLKNGLVEAVTKRTELNLTLPKPLNPGETATERLDVIPTAKGRGELQVIATTGTLSDTASHFIDVLESAANVKIEGPNKRYVGRNADFVITVNNPSDAPLANITVKDTLPPEMDPLSADNNGQIAGREVVWNLGQLGPRETRQLKVTARCNLKAPRAEQRVGVFSDNNQLGGVQTWAVDIFGAAGLTLDVRDLEDPVPAGKNAEYEIVVKNTGTEDATNIVIRGEIKGGLVKVLGGTGPAGPLKVSPQGNECLFDPLPVLRPGETKTYRVTVQTGNVDQDGVFRCSLTATQLDTPVVHEEPTRVYLPK